MNRVEVINTRVNALKAKIEELEKERKGLDFKIYEGKLIKAFNLLQEVAKYDSQMIMGICNECGHEHFSPQIEWDFESGHRAMMIYVN